MSIFGRGYPYVLNLVINGLPSIREEQRSLLNLFEVLNLVINGLPSIQYDKAINRDIVVIKSFKPCYKWITFNTSLNIALKENIKLRSFKPCYKWITFNT